MTETTDEIARNVAYNRLLDILDERSAHTVADTHTVTFERTVNEHGQPVRRYVLRGAWEVDPNPPTHMARQGDIVRFRDRERGEGEWTVAGAPYTAASEGYQILALSRGGVRDYTTLAEVEIVRRPQ
jgi:hypothetical protein